MQDMLVLCKFEEKKLGENCETFLMNFYLKKGKTFRRLFENVIFMGTISREVFYEKLLTSIKES